MEQKQDANLEEIELFIYDKFSKEYENEIIGGYENHKIKCFME